MSFWTAASSEPAAITGLAETSSTFELPLVATAFRYLPAADAETVASAPDISGSSVQSAAGVFASSAAYQATVAWSVTSIPWVESLLICGVVVTRSRLYSPAAVTLSDETHSTVLSRALAVTLIFLPTSAAEMVRLPSVLLMPSVSSVQSASPSPLAYHAMVSSASSGTSFVEPDQLPGTCTLGVIFEPTLSVTFLSASSMPASLY